MTEGASAPHSVGGPSWTRRLIVAGLAAAPEIALAAPTSGGSRTAGQAHQPLARALRTILGDPDAARALGRAYLGREPGAVHGVMELARDLMAAAARGPEAVRRRVAMRRECDWRAGNVVVVDGWVLARTEAELCTLTLAS
jgi:hypothetical protein